MKLTKFKARVLKSREACGKAGEKTRKKKRAYTECIALSKAVFMYSPHMCNIKLREILNKISCIRIFVRYMVHEKIL